MSEETLQELIKKADQLVVNGDFAVALNLYIEASLLDPDNLVVVKNIGNMYFKLSRLEDGIKEYIKYASMLKSAGNFSDAEKICKELLEFNAADPKLSFADKKTLASGPLEAAEIISKHISSVAINLAHIYFQSASFDAAEEVCQKALQKNPDDADIHIVLGRIYGQTGKDKEALGEFQEAIRISSEKAPLSYECLGDILSKNEKKKKEAVSNYYNAASGYKKNEYFEKEIEVYKKILNIDAENTKALANLADAYLSGDNLEEALNVLKNLIAVYEKEGLVDKIILVYERMYELDKENSEIAEKLIEIYKNVLEGDSSNLSASHKLIAHLIGLGKIDEAVPVFITLAGNYLENNMLDEGINICNEIIEISPDNARAYEILGELQFKAGNKPEALSAYVKAYEIFKKQGAHEDAGRLSKILRDNFSDEGKVHYQLASSFFDNKQYDKAREEIQAALKGEPRDVNSLKLYISILEEEGASEELINVCRKVLQLNPEDLKARERLIELYLNYGRIEDAVKESKYLGDILCENKDYKTSEKIFRNILKFFPEDVDVRERIAYLLFHRNQIQKAKTELVNILTHDLKEDNISHAIDICRKIIKIHPQDFNVYHVLGRLAHKSGLIKEALSCFMFLADLYLINKLYYKAAEIIKEILKISSKQTRYRAELIKLLILEERADLAKEHYKILVRDLLEEQNISKAKDAAKKLIALSADDLAVRGEIIITFVKNGIVNEGLEFLDDLLNLMENRADYEKAESAAAPVLDILRKSGYSRQYWALRQRSSLWLEKKGDTLSFAQECFQILKGWLQQGYFEEASFLAGNFIAYIKEKGTLEYFEKLKALSAELYSGNLFEASASLLKHLSGYYRETEDRNSLIGLLSMLINASKKLEKHEDALGFYGELADIYSRAANDAENLLKCRFEEVDLLLAINRTNDIERVFAEISKIKNTPDVKLKMADIFYQIGDYAKAAALYEEIFDVVKEDTSSLVKLIISHINLDEVSKAVQYMKIVVSKGVLYIIMDKLKTVIKDKLTPVNQTLFLAKTYAEISFYEDALNLLFALDAKDPDLDVKMLIGQYLTESGRFRLAVKQYKQILTMPLKEEQTLAVTYNLAQSYEAAGQFREGLESYQDCYAIDIKYKDAAEKVKQLSEKLR